MPLIMDHVSHVYGDDTALAVKALDDVSLTIPDGQFVGLIGHTGSGKSTLVQHLNGLLKATSGHISQKRTEKQGGTCIPVPGASAF